MIWRVYRCDSAGKLNTLATLEIVDEALFWVRCGAGSQTSESLADPTCEQSTFGLGGIQLNEIRYALPVLSY